MKTILAEFNGLIFKDFHLNFGYAPKNKFLIIRFFILMLVFLQKFPILYHILSYYGYGDQAVCLMNSVTKYSKENKFKNELVFAKSLKKREISLYHKSQAKALSTYKTIFYDLNITMSSALTLKDLHYMLNMITDSYEKLEKVVRAETLIKNLSTTPSKGDREMVFNYLDITDKIKLSIVKLVILNDISLTFNDLAQNFEKSAYKILCLDKCKYEYNRNTKTIKIGSDLVEANIITSSDQIDNQFVAIDDGHHNINFIEQIDFLDVMLSQSCSVEFFNKGDTKIPILKFKEVIVQLINVGQLKTKDLIISDKVISAFLKNETITSNLETLIISTYHQKLANTMLFKDLKAVKFNKLHKIEFHKPDYAELGQFMMLFYKKQGNVSRYNIPNLEILDFNFYMLNTEDQVKTNISQFTVKSGIIKITDKSSIYSECYMFKSEEPIEIYGGQVLDQLPLNFLLLNYVSQIKFSTEKLKIDPYHFDDDLTIPTKYDIDSLKIENAIKSSKMEVQVIVNYTEVLSCNLFAKTNEMLLNGLISANSLKRYSNKNIPINLCLDVGKKSAKEFNIANYKDFLSKNVFTRIILQPNSMRSVEFNNSKLGTLLSKLCKVNRELGTLEICPYLNQSYTQKISSGIMNKNRLVLHNLQELSLNFEYFEDSMAILELLGEGNSQKFTKIRLVSQELEQQKTKSVAICRAYTSKGIELILQFVEMNKKLTHLHIVNIKGRRQVKFNNSCLIKYLMAVL